MASIAEPRTDLKKLAERLRVVAETLKQLPSQGSSLEERKALSEEILAIAAQLRKG